MSEQGRKLLMQREGVRLTAYKDSVGVWTIGVGHTAAAGEPNPKAGMTITAAECDAILTRDLVQYEQAIEKALTVPVEQHEFDALVSICFNVGPKFANSTCMRLLNRKDRGGAASAIMLWNKPSEIIGRRQSEQRQFLTPYAAPAAPTPRPVPASVIPKPAPAAPPAPAKSGWLEAIFSAVLTAFRKKP